MRNIWIILKKELTDLLRDKKTVIVSLLVPIILYPIMFGALNFVAKDSEKDAIDKGIKVVVTGNEKSNAIDFLKMNKSINITTSSNPEEELKKGRISLIVDIPKDFDENIQNEKKSGIKIIKDISSSKSMMASSMVKETLSSYEQTIVKTRMERRGVDMSLITPFTVEQSTLDKKDQDEGMMANVFIGFIPIIIIISVIAGSIPVAQDLAAGEKERATFEPLLSTAVSRTSILWGKLFAITVMGLLTVICNVLGMIISIKFVFKGDLATMTPMAMLFIVIFGVLISIATSALELSASVYARSAKEAGTYLSIVSITGIVLSYLPMGVDVKSVKDMFFHIPITNVVVLLKEIIFGIYNTSHIFIVLGWLVVYIAVATLFTRHMFSKEEVIFRS